MIGAVDEGTGSTRFTVYDNEMNTLYSSKRRIRTFHNNRTAEQDPNEIYNKTMINIKDAIKRFHIRAIGVTNQRETSIFWNNEGMPLANAISWQDKRFSSYAKMLKKEYGDLFIKKTGLIPDPYFSAIKIKYLMSRNPLLREKAANGRIKFGTVDSYILYKMLNRHVTDYSNASRTMLFNIKNLEYDDEILKILDIPEKMLPEPMPSDSFFGSWHGIDINAVLGDQNSSLFGHNLIKDDPVKATFGTGTFIMSLTSDLNGSSRLLKTIAWSMENNIKYALEGSIFDSGSFYNWARSTFSGDPVYQNRIVMVPAFSGLGAPYWEPGARTVITGIDYNSTGSELLSAAIQGIGFQVYDILKEIKNRKYMTCDGSGSRNEFLMQFISDLSNIDVITLNEHEITSFGIAAMAGTASGIIKDINKPGIERIYTPSGRDYRYLYKKWRHAVNLSIS
ncbi:FGGY family carbohydrate kinase [Picrophilus oshimae]|uniref:Glycerol kinase n=1 Tax=Picrophilus torridus (strain ATCC 700027 / DSM 9790 / JCM 10055 / NBRC 100828 / KAW 2/3) TaxID=1122961 RepID=A0A8G2FWP2_PICTO|nr:FGGY family carbohydrate kinase [Picrophilus oshimae]SMD30862.1 glycerol kinase [Picrophilus oshimae DSM 9789]